MPRGVRKLFTRGSVALVGVALLVGVTAIPASAATITSFLPTSGPPGTSVTLTGTGFNGTTAVQFNAVASTFTINSDTQITASVPCAATDGPITVVNPGGNATSGTNFDVTTAGTPTITSFTPTSGPTGTSVTINGTNFCGATAVRFNGVTATHTVDSATKITATVPATATSGIIEVVTPAGTATSSSPFTVTTGGGGGDRHARSATLALRRHLRAVGRVNVPDGTSACAANAKVVIQRFRNGAWRFVGTDRTNANGQYREPLRDKPGRYRAKAVKFELADGDVCRPDVSPVRTHRH